MRLQRLLLAGLLSLNVEVRAEQPRLEVANEFGELIESIDGAQQPQPTWNVWQNLAVRLAQHAKWQSAVVAQTLARDAAAGGETERARILILLARYKLHAGDVAGARIAVEESERFATGLAAQWIHAEIALAAREWWGDVTEVFRKSPQRGSQADDRLAPILYCLAESVPSSAINAYLKARLALEAGNADAALLELQKGVGSTALFPEARMTQSNALHQMGRSMEALQVLRNLRATLAKTSRCPAVSLDRVLLSEGNILWDLGQKEGAEASYRAAIAKAEEHELGFARAIAANLPASEGLPIVRVLRPAIEPPSYAAPEARNNLAQLLLELAPTDLDRRQFARQLLQEAIASPRYQTRQYAWVALGRLKLADGDDAGAMESTALALLEDPKLEEALDLAAILMQKTEEPVVAARAGVLLLDAASDVLPRRFVESRFGSAISALERQNRQIKAEYASHFLATLDLFRGRTREALEIAAAASQLYPEAVWPQTTKVLAQATSLEDAERRDILIGIAERVRRQLPAPWERAATRQVLTSLDEAAGKRWNTRSLLTDEALALVSTTWLPFDDPASTSRGTVLGKIAVKGTITDVTGAVVPGATVQLPLPGMGTLATTTDIRGQYELPAVVGRHILIVSFGGMQPLQKEIAVGAAGAVADIELSLEGVSESITVTAVAPLVEVQSTSTAIVSVDVAELPAIGRSFIGLTRAPRLIINSKTAIFGGVTVPEEPGSDYAREPVRFLGLQLNEQIFTAGNPSGELAPRGQPSVATIAGQSAALGEAGGVQLSFSPTEEVSGSIEGRTVPAVLSGDAAPAVVPAAASRDRGNNRIHISAGMPLVRDKLWTFIQAELRRERSLLGQGPYRELNAATHARELGIFGKSNFSTTRTTHSLNLFTRRERREGVVDDLGGGANGTPSALTRVATRRTVAATINNSVTISSSVWGDLRVAAYRDVSSLQPDSPAGTSARYRDIEGGFIASNGVGYVNDGRALNRRSLAANGNATTGVNEFKGGLQVETTDDSVNDYITGNLIADVMAGRFLRTRTWVASSDETETRVRERFHERLTAAYVQYSYDNDVNLLAGAGVRLERQEVSFVNQRLETTAILPRLGATFLGAGEHLRSIGLGYGFYAEPVSSDDRVAYGTARRYLTLCDSCEAHTYEYGELAAIDPDLKPPYSDELYGHASVVLNGKLSLTMTAKHRRLISHIEDFVCTDDGRKCLGNPGQGMMKYLRQAPNIATLVESPRARRTVTSLDATLAFHKEAWSIAKRDVRIDGYIRYIWMRRHGNIEAPDLASTKVLATDIYTRTAFDYGDFMTNADGPLSRDRRHTVMTSWWGQMEGMRLGHAFRLYSALWFRTGEPRARFGYSEQYGRYVYFLARRGSDGRAAYAFDGDMRCDYDVALGTAKLTLALSIENVLNRRAPAVEDHRWSFVERDNSAPAPTNSTLFLPMERYDARTVSALARIVF